MLTESIIGQKTLLYPKSDAEDLCVPGEISIMRVSYKIFLDNK